MNGTTVSRPIRSDPPMQQPPQEPLSSDKIEEEAKNPLLPRMWRVMFADYKNQPIVADDAGLGVREGLDVSVGPSDIVPPGEGMSVFERVRDGLLDLHELFLEGKGSSEKAKAIRNATDEPWLNLSDEQQDIFNGLAQDLLDAQEVKSEPELPSIPPADPGVLEAAMLQHNGRYFEALARLRENRSSKPFSLLSFFRGRCWEGLDEPRVALMFFNHAHKLAPKHEEFEAAALGVLADAYPEKGRAEVQRIIEKAQAESPIVVIRACEIAFHHAQESENEAKAREIYDPLTLALHEACSSLQSGNGRWKPRVISEYQPYLSCAIFLVGNLLSQHQQD